MRYSGVTGFVLPHSASSHSPFTFQLLNLLGIPQMERRALMNEIKTQLHHLLNRITASQLSAR